MPSEEFADNLRIRAEERDPLLDKLDQASAKTPANSRRGSQRLEYRVEGVPVTITHPGGSVARFLVKARNLSAGGMSFLNGGFLHQNTECRIVLKTVDGRQVIVDSRVRTCRLIQQHIHEVGVQFHEKLDPRMFCGRSATVTSRDGEPAVRGSVLLVALHELEERGLFQRLRACGLTVLTASSLGASLDLLRRLPFDGVICSDSSRAEPVAEMLRKIREAGHAGMLAVLSDAVSPALTSELEGNALCVCFPRPVRIDLITQALHGTMCSGEASPIYSELTRDDSHVDFFIDEARTLARQLGEAALRRDVSTARKACLQVRTTAGGYGFGAIAEVARQSEQQLMANPHAPDAFRALEFLAELMLRLRAGYQRSAA